METIKTMLLLQQPSSTPTGDLDDPKEPPLSDLLPASAIVASPQPPVIVGMAVKRTLPTTNQQQQQQQLADVFEKWHADIFGSNTNLNTNDCNNNGKNDAEVVEVDNGVDLIDFSTELEDAVPPKGDAKPKVKKVTFLLDEEEEDDEDEEEEEEEEEECDVDDDECVTKEGEWDVSDTVEVGWGAAAGNEISTETTQTDDIVSSEGGGTESVQRACSTFDDGRNCQHPRASVHPRSSGAELVVETALPTKTTTTTVTTADTNTLVELLLDSDTAPAATSGERWKIDELPAALEEASACRQNACAEAGNRGRIDDASSKDALLVDVGEQDCDAVGSTASAGGPRRWSSRTVPERTRIDETVTSQHSLRPCAKEVENVVTAARSGQDQLEFGRKSPPNSLQLCEKSIQVPSPSRRGCPEQHQQQQQQREVRFEKSTPSSSDSESENYYGTCSPSPPPPVVPPANGGIPPPPTSSYGLNVEVTLNAHISVHGLSEFGFFGAERTEDSGSRAEKILRDCATNTGGDNNANVTPSSADSGIIIIDDDVDECSGDGSGLAEPQEIVVIEQQQQCRDQDTQTFDDGSFPRKNTSEISVQVCANGDSDLRRYDEVDSSVSESEIDERKDLRFLTKNTDQYLRPPLSFLSEKHECFEASNRLKRLEERFRGFAYTKKLLRESAGASQSGGGQNLSSSLSSLSTLLEHTNTSAAASQHLSALPASSSSSTAVDAGNTNRPTDSSFVPSWKTSSLSCLQDAPLNHVPKPPPALPPLSSSLLSLSASSLLSLSCIDLERKHQQQQQQHLTQPKTNQLPTQNNKKHLSKASSLPSLLPQYLFPAPPSRLPPKPPQQQQQQQPPDEDAKRGTPESSVASEEISAIFPGGKPRVEDPLDVLDLEPKQESDEEDGDDDDDDVEDVTADVQEFLNLEKLLAADPHTNCEFDTRHFPLYEPDVYRIKYCYDELEEELECETGSVGGLLIGTKPVAASVVSSASALAEGEEDEEDPDGCGCVIEAVPIYRTLPLNMRETTGTLRGLLKKPNRPPPVRKNRVVFDETRNEFFEADYIILIREDCPYDEEDEEPCTCGEHELVRICCDEGCNCGYTTTTTAGTTAGSTAAGDDGRTPPVSVTN